MIDELSVPVRLAGFLLVALVVFAAAWAIGRAVGPIGTEIDEEPDHGHALVVTPSTPEGATR